MHNIKRTSLTAEEREARKRRERSKIDEFTMLSDTLLSKKKNGDWSRDAFDLTTRLLQINPEFYTIWNYRRNTLIKGLFVDSSPEAINNLLTDELAMTMSALKTHPKVYWIWNHRMWCLENIPQGPGHEFSDKFSGWKQKAWERELFVVEKLLDADARNFLAWNYRRYVLGGMPVPRPESAELAFTSRKIEANFSNFSAWHQRSKTLSSLWAQGKLDERKSREEEFELLRNAMYTDPNDQSVWMYHRWLVGTDGSKSLLEREIAAIQELLDEQPDSKWCMESIVRYKRLLLKNWTPQAESSILTTEIRDLLQRLEEVDPSRRQRYQDLGNVHPIKVLSVLWLKLIPEEKHVSLRGCPILLPGTAIEAKMRTMNSTVEERIEATLGRFPISGVSVQDCGPVRTRERPQNDRFDHELTGQSASAP